MEKKYVMSFYNVCMAYEKTDPPTPDNKKKKLALKIDLLEQAIECGNAPSYFYGILAMSIINKMKEYDGEDNATMIADNLKMQKMLTHALAHMDSIGLFIASVSLCYEGRFVDGIDYINFAIKYAEKKESPYAQSTIDDFKTFRDIRIPEIRKKQMVRSSDDISNMDVDTDVDTKRQKKS